MMQKVDGFKFCQSFPIVVPGKEEGEMKDAILVAMIGAGIGVFIHGVSSFTTSAFFYRNPIGLAINAIPHLCYLYFFWVLWNKQR